MYITYIIDYYMSITGSLEEENAILMWFSWLNEIIYCLNKSNDTRITLFIIAH